ncbi:DinB family protein [Flavobacteriaceae bacterium 3-367]
MMNKMETTEKAQVITAAELLEHWQGHRNLTRKLIVAFPEKEFFDFSIGGMRPFAEMVLELLAIAAPAIREIATGKPEVFNEHPDHGKSKDNILQWWDKATEEINDHWKGIPTSRFHETIKTFGQWDGTVQSSIFYFMDNEIHHRGQGYVYLRALGIEPPLFWER